MRMSPTTSIQPDTTRTLKKDHRSSEEEEEEGPDDDNSISTSSINSEMVGKEAAAAFARLAVHRRPQGDEDEDDHGNNVPVAATVTAASSSSSSSSKTTIKPKKQIGDRDGGGGVRFGSVRVHTHRRVLGDNPGGKEVGPPVEFDWNPQESLRYGTVDDFVLNEHGTRDSLRIPTKVHRLDAAERQRIAARDHSAGSIRKIQKQIHDIRRAREQSQAEDLEEAERLDALQEARRRKQHQHQQQDQKKGLGGLLKRVFHHG